MCTDQLQKQHNFVLRLFATNQRQGVVITTCCIMQKTSCRACQSWCNNCRPRATVAVLAALPPHCSPFLGPSQTDPQGTHPAASSQPGQSRGSNSCCASDAASYFPHHALSPAGVDQRLSVHVPQPLCQPSWVALSQQLHPKQLAGYTPLTCSCISTVPDLSLFEVILTCSASS